MNLKAKFQRFWTLSQNRKGFTLVELIVVIAILAILAGVAIPVYNGYIKKAQNAADQQLLDSINTAYAAACLSEGVNHEEVVAFVTINADGLICEKDANGQYLYAIAINDAKGADADEIMSNFAMFYAGNETSAFKGEQFLDKTFSLPITEGGASGNDDRTESFYLGDKEVFLNNGSIVAIRDTENNFIDNMGELQGQVNILAGVFGAGYNKYLGMDEYQQKLAEKVLGTGILTSLEGDSAAEIGNNAVFYVAEQTKNLTDDQVTAVFDAVQTAANSNGTVDIYAAIGETGVDQAAAMSLIYGSAVAYANSGNANRDFKNAVDGAASFGGFQNMLAAIVEQDDTNFLTNYVGKDQHKTDVDAYIGTLDIVNSISGSLDKDDLNNTNGNLWTDNEDINNLLVSLGLKSGN